MCYTLTRFSSPRSFTKRICCSTKLFLSKYADFICCVSMRVCRWFGLKTNNTKHVNNITQQQEQQEQQTGQGQQTSGRLSMATEMCSCSVHVMRSAIPLLFVLCALPLVRSHTQSLHFVVSVSVLIHVDDVVTVRVSTDYENVNQRLHTTRIRTTTNKKHLQQQPQQNNNRRQQQITTKTTTTNNRKQQQQTTTTRPNEEQRTEESAYSQDTQNKKSTSLNHSSIHVSACTSDCGNLSVNLYSTTTHKQRRCVHIRGICFDLKNHLYAGPHCRDTCRSSTNRR